MLIPLCPRGWTEVQAVVAASRRSSRHDYVRETKRWPFHQRVARNSAPKSLRDADRRRCGWMTVSGRAALDAAGFSGGRFCYLDTVVSSPDEARCSSNLLEKARSEEFSAG